MKEGMTKGPREQKAPKRRAAQDRRDEDRLLAALVRARGQGLDLHDLTSLTGLSPEVLASLLADLQTRDVVVSTQGKAGEKWRLR